jgi:hypothetical protein
MSSSINAFNITSENITVTNLTVTNINGRPYTGSGGCGGSYYTSCPSCDGQPGEEPCVDCGSAVDVDPCDCLVPNPCTGPQGATGPVGMTGAQGVRGATGAQGVRGATGATGATGPQGVTGAIGFTGAQGATGPSGTNTLQQVLDAGNGATGVNARISLTNTGIGGITNPQLVLNNSNATAGFTFGVPSIEMYKSGRLAIANDIIASQNFYADTTGPTKTEFARIEVISQNVGGLPGLDGTIILRTLVNGAFNTFISLNGSSQQIEIGKEIDLNSNNIVTSSGNLTISTVASSGTGNITLAKAATGNLIFSGLPTSSAGLPTGAVWNNLGVLNIV